MLRGFLKYIYSETRDKAGAGVVLYVSNSLAIVTLTGI